MNPWIAFALGALSCALYALGWKWWIDRRERRCMTIAGHVAWWRRNDVGKVITGPGMEPSRIVKFVSNTEVRIRPLGRIALLWRKLKGKP